MGYHASADFMPPFAGAPETHNPGSRLRKRYRGITNADGYRAFGYDSAGNLTNDGVWGYGWDTENRLVGASNGAVRLGFAYDYLSRRVGKQVYTNAGGAWTLVADTSYGYDGWNLVEEVRREGTTIRTNRYVWGLDLSGTLQGAGGIGGLLAVILDDVPYLACADGNGNVTALVDTNGAVAAKYEYSPFGELLSTTGPAAASNPFRFSTKYSDEETGLVYYGRRYYSPSLGRWLSRDPIGELGACLVRVASASRSGSGGVDVTGAHLMSSTASSFGEGSKDRNMYAFVLNNPIKWIDALGLMGSWMHSPQSAVIVVYLTRVDPGADVQTDDTLRTLRRMDRQLEWSLVSGALPAGASRGRQAGNRHDGQCYRHVYYVEAELSNAGGAWPLGYGRDFSAVVFAERTKRNYEHDDFEGSLDPRVASLGRDTTYARVGGFMLAHEVLHAVGASHRGDDRYVMTAAPAWIWIFRWPVVSQETVDEVKRSLDVFQ